tara:strand:- start:110 stop:367 length:258 start_codon:yes stop_codon:yes gene_type:complete
MDLTNEQKGRRAKEILDDPVFLDVVRTTREGILAQWNLTGYDQSETRENLYHQGRALDEILRGLRTLTTDWTIEKSRNKTRKGRK